MVNAFAQSFFTSLSEELNQDATRASLGLLSFRSDALREHLRGLFQSAPGTGESFLADPVFESTFGWRTVPAVTQHRQPLLPDLANLGNLSPQARFQALASSPGAA